MRFPLWIAVFLAVLVMAKPASARVDGYGDVLVARVPLNGLRPAPNSLRPVPGVKKQWIVWDSGINVYAFNKASRMSSQAVSSFKGYDKAGTTPPKATILAGTKVTNLYVLWRGGDTVDVLSAVNGPDGQYTVPHDRAVALYSDAWLAVGTCTNLFLWSPPKKEVTPPKPRPVCATLKICKQVEGDSRLSGFRFSLWRLVDGKPDMVTILVTDDDGRARYEIRTAGQYLLREIDLPEGYKVVEPSNGQHEFTVSAEDDVLLKSFTNRYTPKPKPRPVCTTLKVCKDTDGSDKRDFDFQLLRLLENGGTELVTTFRTDADGRARHEIRMGGRYRVKEVNLPENFELVEPKDGFYDFEVTPDSDVIVKMFRNKYCRPKPTYDSETTPPSTPVLPELPGRVSGYFPGTPEKSVRSETVAGFGLYSQRTVNKTNTKVIRCCKPEHPKSPPGGPVPPGRKPPGQEGGDTVPPDRPPSKQ